MMLKAHWLIAVIGMMVSSASAELYLIDTMDVIIFGEEDTAIITRSDVQRPSLEGSPRTLTDILLEQLMYADAKKYRIIPDEEAIDRHLQAVQREHNITLDQLKQIFKNAGYSYEEGRKQFSIMTTVNSMLDFKIRSRLLVPEREVVAYYKDNPEMEEATYTLQKVFIPLAHDLTNDEHAQKLRELSAASLDALAWGEPFTVITTELAEDKQFLTELAVGIVCEPQEVAGGFELYRLIAKKEKREKPLADRFNEISDILRKPRYEKLFAEYKKELFDNASIVYLHEKEGVQE